MVFLDVALRSLVLPLHLQGHLNHSELCPKASLPYITYIVQNNANHLPEYLNHIPEDHNLIIPHHGNLKYDA
jgi:hypothetical protein